jgi:hypothetical protein
MLERIPEEIFKLITSHLADTGFTFFSHYGDPANKYPVCRPLSLHGQTSVGALALTSRHFYRLVFPTLHEEVIFKIRGSSELSAQERQEALKLGLSSSNTNLARYATIMIVFFILFASLICSDV